ncbi:IS66 family insertion sequence element accessory protein TnpA [Ruminiclostridium cellobioparum]|uniref:IS66 family insertion sequence element accessory protein TnpA n=1 Tax=Ruminiclostridium cellobioparum TaxID=29355 RepID=UPI00406BBA22
MDQKPLELWKQRISDRKASGLKVTDWCDKNNLTKHAYYYWMKRVKADIQKSILQYLFLPKLNPNIYRRKGPRNRSLILPGMILIL